LTNTAEEIQLALQGLEDADGYEYTAPEE